MSPLMYRFMLVGWLTGLAVYVMIVWGWPPQEPCTGYICTYLPTLTPNCYYIVANGSVLHQCVICQTVTNGTQCYVHGTHTQSADDWCPRYIECPTRGRSVFLLMFASIGAGLLMVTLIYLIYRQPTPAEETQQLLPARSNKTTNPPWIINAAQHTSDSVDV
jgi:hypothetical protein